MASYSSKAYQLRRLMPAVLAMAAATHSLAEQRQLPRPEAPRPRIVTFSPALTQIVFDMGLGDHVVGVTGYCTPPEGAARPRVGDAFTINAEVMLSVAPDVIIAQTSPDKFKGVRDLNPNVSIVELRIETLADIQAAMRRVGEIVGRPERARQQAAAFAEEIQFIRREVAGLPRPRVLFVMGTDRPTAAGRDNFIADLIEACGGLNAGADIPGSLRWRQTTIEAIVKAAPDILICQNEVKGKEEAARKYWLSWKDLPAAGAGRVYVVSDPQWLIPSTRITALAVEMAKMIHPEAFAAPDKTAAPGSAAMPLWLARLLRLVAAAIVGAALAAAGMALQALLRNPLAEPYILGISSGAGVGVLLGLALAAWYAAIPVWASTPVLAFAAALATCAVVYTIAQRRGRLDPYSLILSGVVVNIFNGAIMLTIYLYIDPSRIADFAHWGMGRLPDSVDKLLLILCGACVAVGWLVLLLSGSAFNVLGLGDEVAASSGVNVHRLRLVTFACVGLMTAAAVALAGPIGFLGLIVPHICRMIFGPEHRRLVVISGLAGAAFLVGAESLCRTVGPWINVSLIPVGIVTALCGGPFFIFLLRRRFREAAA